TQTKGRGPATFDFLGFTFYWFRTRWGRWVIRCKTRSARLRRTLSRISRLCQRRRHDSVANQHCALVSRLKGHFQYFGVNGNLRCLRLVQRSAQRIWHKWLNRRSQRSRLTWERFKDFLRSLPLPTPRIFVQIWGSAP